MENRIMYQNRVSLILGKDAEAKTTRNNASFTVLLRIPMMSITHSDAMSITGGA